MSTAKQSLIDMGFPENRVEKALVKTGNQGAQLAMDWLFAHQDDPDIDDPLPEGSSGHQLGESEAAEGGQSDQSAQPKSIKCDDCGKLFKSELDVQAHAARTQHSNFSESTDAIRPLTAEEKQQQLAKLEERRKQKKLEREEQEKKEAISREKVRRKTGKELSEIKQKMELQEAKKIAEERKREKMEEKLARQKVREQIARDRAEKEARAREAQASSQATTQVQQPAQPTAPAAKKEYSTCKLQIRLIDGSTLVHAFNVTDSLVDVNQYILMNQPGQNAPYSLMTTFPRKVFTEHDHNKTLKELGLVPSAVVVQTKAT